MVLMSLLFLTFIVGTVGALVSRKYYTSYWIRKGLIAHAEPAPYFGNFFPILFKKQPMPNFINQIYNLFPEAKYTGIFQFKQPIIVLRDPELIKDICIKNFDNFPDHKGFLPEDADPIFGRLLFFQRGDRWKEMRNTLTPAFTGSKMKIIFELVSKCSENFVQYFLDNPKEANSVEMNDTFRRYANDVIATAAFGITVNSLQNKNNEFFLKGKDATNFNTIIRLLKMMALRLFTKFMKYIDEPLMSRSTTKFFQTIIQETVRTREENNIVRPDMLQLLIEASHKEDGLVVTIDDIVAQAYLFFLAGFSTSATAMGFVAHELAVNPEVQEKLRNEVDHFTKQGGKKISYDTLSKMKYLDMVVSETLRKYPPNALMDRKCLREYTLPKATPDSKEYTTEPDSFVWLPIYALHHDEKYFPDPERFDPERFNEENKDKINPYVYIPFGIGPRKCIGDRFALMEIKILFVHLLQNFVLEKEERTYHPVVFEKGFLLAADGDFWVRFSKRIY